MIAALPPAISRIIVSPMARPKASTNDAKIAGAAAGMTTLSAVCRRVAPSASDASRYARGTAASPSSEIVKTIGTSAMASAMPAFHAFNL